MTSIICCLRFHVPTVGKLCVLSKPSVSSLALALFAGGARQRVCCVSRDDEIGGRVLRALPTTSRRHHHCRRRRRVVVGGGQRRQSVVNPVHRLSADARLGTGVDSPRAPSLPRSSSSAAAATAGRRLLHLFHDRSTAGVRIQLGLLCVRVV